MLPFYMLVVTDSAVNRTVSDCWPRADCGMAETVKGSSGFQHLFIDGEKVHILWS